jgi:hypothetical protein
MMERTRQQSTPGILSRFLWGLKRAFPSSSLNESESEQAPSELEICCNAGNIILNQEQILELYEFIEEACHNRDQRIPQLEASLSEANNVISDHAKEHAALLERLSAQADDKQPWYEMDPPDPPIQSDLLFLPQSINKQPTSTDQDLLTHQKCDETMSALNQQIKMLEIDNERMRETLERYEVAVAMYKGDRKMLLTDALKKSFCSPNYKLLVPRDSKEKEPEQGVTLGVETDLVEIPLPAAEDEDMPQSESVCQVPRTIVTMMQGCWMYKYPRRRFHHLISLPCLPLGRLTYRFFWLCPENKAIMWQDKGSFFSSTSCKVGTSPYHANSSFTSFF